MKFNLLIILICFSLNLGAQNLKPYTIAVETSGNLESTNTKTRIAIRQHGFKIVGMYTPSFDRNRRLIFFTTGALLSAVRKEDGFQSFASVLKVAITQEGDKIIISYATPEYWMSAYFQKDYTHFQKLAESLHDRIQNALSSLGTEKDEGFGSNEGLTSEELQNYHYMWGMPYFEDNIELASYPDFHQAIMSINSNLKNLVGVKEAYSLKIPGQNIKLYGIGLTGNEDIASLFASIDDISPKHTAALPFEILVIEGKVYMMSGSYRIGLSFPDLGVFSFLGIYSAPGDIKEALERAAQEN